MKHWRPMGYEGPWVRKLLKQWAVRFARDDGVAGLVAIGLIIVIAFTALMVLLSPLSGPQRELARLGSTNQGPKLVVSALQAYFFQTAQASRRLPCPDTDFDGDASDETCTGTDSAAGTIPWATIGIGRSDAQDSYGNYFTYIVPAAPASRAMCESIGNDYSSSVAAEYTGKIIEQTALEVRTTGASSGRYVPFVVISHGKNALGAYSASSATGSPVRTSYPDSTNEQANAPFNSGGTATTPNIIYTGPYNGDSSGTSYFDDQVYAPSNEELLKTCEELTPGGQMNATLADNFDGTGTAISTTRFATGGTTPPTQTRVNGDGVANFTAADSYIGTHATNYDFTATVRPVYVSAYWTPVTVPNSFSIATRASGTPTGDTFTTGITFRFSSATGLTIVETAGNVAGPTAFGFTITAGKEYLLEVYDNGDDVWARITQRDTPANTLTVSGATSADLTGDRVFFINGANQSYLDDVAIGFPMLAADFNGTTAYASSAAGTNDFTAANPSLTVEAWINPDSYPGVGAAAVIVSKWDPATEVSAPATQGFRFYMNSGELHLKVAGQNATDTVVATYDSGYTPSLNTWTHVAASYDRTTGTVVFYEDGEAVRTVTNSSMAGRWVNDTTTLPFVVGANGTTATKSNYFSGAISDIRVWETARTAANERACFNERAPSTRCTVATNELAVNWRLDPTPTQGGITATTANATYGDNGTLTNGTFVATLSRYFRAMSTDFCPSGTKVGPYQCDFRGATGAASVTTWDIDIPDSIQAIYAKVWGAGGGGYSGAATRKGGDAGYSAGLIDQIGGADIGTLNLTVMAGAGGAGSTTVDKGAGGGAASVVQTLSGTVSIVAGGGGGASYSIYDECSDDVDCGNGGGGGGVSSTMTRAFDDGSNCGGRGGSGLGTGSGPPATDCGDGGDQNSSSTQGSGSSTGALGGGGAAGGGGVVGSNNFSGGYGYDADDADGTGNSSAVGGGGGGGGSIGGEAGGYEDNRDSSGYGGGGGSGSAAAGVSNATGTSSSRSASFYDAACQLDLTNGSPIASIRSGSCSPTNPITRGWTNGMVVTGNGIGPSDTAYLGSITSTTVTFYSDSGLTTTVNATTGAHPSVVVSGSSGSDTTGGSTDDDYRPSYASSYPYPGLGATSGTRGNPGAVILKW